MYRLPLDLAAFGSDSAPDQQHAELVANLTDVSPVFIEDFTIGRDDTIWITSGGPGIIVVAAGAANST